MVYRVSCVCVRNVIDVRNECMVRRHKLVFQSSVLVIEQFVWLNFFLMICSLFTIKWLCAWCKMDVIVRNSVFTPVEV